MVNKTEKMNIENLKMLIEVLQERETHRMCSSERNQHFEDLVEAQSELIELLR